MAARSLLGCRATLETRLADGGLCRSSGLIHEAARLGGDGGFCRYRLRMAPWPWLLSQATTSRVWQDTHHHMHCACTLSWCQGTSDGPLSRRLSRPRNAGKYRRISLGTIHAGLPRFRHLGLDRRPCSYCPAG
ncbi:phage late control D family protein [Herbaspirillum huttiense]|uniref:Phage late control D family protein n=1 Tax=Herbaspirillum huttiense subsp. lycopersici TaxID=3074428 RepID=A0ABU2EUF1_9BURK|nr:phage late control D family protein [Herbaspirillum huttiense]MDR9851809.1 phage late control D family protein [Herbaspirillum huttiense SE1]